VVKVDTHIHAASAVVAPKLLAFIKNKYATSPNVRLCSPLALAPLPGRQPT
jgi:hypothetical protein